MHKGKDRSNSFRELQLGFPHSMLHFACLLPLTPCFLLSLLSPLLTLSQWCTLFMGSSLYPAFWMLFHLSLYIKFSDPLPFLLLLPIHLLSILCCVPNALFSHITVHYLPSPKLSSSSADFSPFLALTSSLRIFCFYPFPLFQFSLMYPFL